MQQESTQKTNIIMKTRFMITTLLCCLFSMTALAQNKSSFSKKYGSYAIEFNRDKDSYMIKNNDTGEFVKQTITYKGSEVFMQINFRDFVRFLHADRGYCYDFDGLVYVSSAHLIDPEIGEEIACNGVFRIENESLIPVVTAFDGNYVFTKSSNILIYNRVWKGREEYKKNPTNKNLKKMKVIGGTTSIYNSDFELVKEVEVLPYDDLDPQCVKFKHNDGKEETLYCPIGYDIYADQSGKYGINDHKGRVLLPCSLTTREEARETIFTKGLWSFKSYSRELVAKKSDFETQAEYEARRNNPELQQQYVVSKGLDKKYYKPYRISLGKYDAETETFPINGFMAFMRGGEPVVVNISWNDFRISIPRAEAEDFYNNFGNLNKNALNDATMCIRYDAPAVQEITFNGPDGKTYCWKRE